MEGTENIYTLGALGRKLGCTCQVLANWQDEAMTKKDPGSAVHSITTADLEIHDEVQMPEGDWLAGEGRREK